jgi:hypothetical protein
MPMFASLLAPPPAVSGPGLPAAVPAYAADVEVLERIVGRQAVYVAQLQVLLDQRATETNRLHDELTAAQARIAELEQQHRAGQELE